MGAVEDEREAARAVAIHYLEYSARSRSQLERRLERDGFSPETVLYVVEDCQSRRYIDDEAFAGRWVEDRGERKLYGKRRLQSELRGRGVDKESVETALESVSEDDELRRAQEALEKRWKPGFTRARDSAEASRERTRMMGYLARRGFGARTIGQVLKQALENSA